jgi:hypothetical protein
MAMSNDECLNLRRLAEEPEGGAPFNKHMENCDACKVWHRENEEMLAMVGAMPQFDVSEALTQNIMTAVSAQPRRHLASSLMMPVGVVALAACCTVLPFDTLEGLLSSAVGMFGLYFVYLVLKAAPHEEYAS